VKWWAVHVGGTEWNVVVEHGVAGFDGVGCGVVWRDGVGRGVG